MSSKRLTDVPRRIEAHEPVKMNEPLALPFATTLSLHKLLDLWRDSLLDADPLQAEFRKKIFARVEATPELHGPIEDMSLLTKHKDLISFLMSGVVAPQAWEKHLVAAIKPYGLLPFYTTPNFDKYLQLDGSDTKYQMNLDADRMASGRLIHSYTSILARFYNINLGFDFPVVVCVPDKTTGMERFYKMMVDTRFMDIALRGKLRKLSEADIERLYANLTDVDVWLELLPPELFEMRGFSLLHATDITDQEAVSGMRLDLIRKGALSSDDGFRQLEQKMRSYMKRPHLRLGVAAYSSDMASTLSLSRRIGRSLVLTNECKLTCTTLDNSIYERAINAEGPIIIDDIESGENRSEVEEHILRLGIRNILVTPLWHNNRLVGMLELGSPNPRDLNHANILKLHELLPLFANAIDRSLDELNNRVEAVIKEECTAIHPTVEWRFRSAAIKLLQDQDQGGTRTMESIVFEDVYPLYGVSDIRDSSIKRNRCIQADLTDQLQMAREIVEEARKLRPMPILNEIVFRINKHIDNIRRGLSSGDELSTLDFLRSNVESLFAIFRELDPSVKAKVEEYTAALDPELQVVYRRRQEFDRSVAMINDTISSYLDEEQSTAQKIFPHYFEKYKTDGVEHGIYVGKSLAKRASFDPIYLSNLRLWQLMVMCNIARRSRALQASLPQQLETTQLILLHNTPLSIRFRQDEKKFDVDGAYNMRYEIMKKRIDKSRVKDKRERITQPDAIAVVYTQAKEAAEYREYFEFLQAAGILNPGVEELELEDLPGISGLKALRVKVNLRETASDGIIDPERIRQAIAAMLVAPESTQTLLAQEA